MAFVPRSDEDSVSVEAHLARVLGGVAPLPPYEQPLLEALGLPVSDPIRSPMDLPAFDNSAMDGYAVLAADVDGATHDEPVQLPVVGEVAAGQSRILALSPGSAVKIMTGAPLPAGADAVVPVEWTDGGAAGVRISRAPRAGQHVRRRGEDVRSGDLLLEADTLLGPRQLALLAAVGQAQVRSRPRPRVVVLSTGSELREPGSPRGEDAVYDANSYGIAAAVRRAGAIAYRVGIVPDDPDDFMDALSDQLVRADVVVTSGGVSRGEYDIVKDALSQLGTVWFGQVQMQPGKPQGFGHVGEDRIPIFTLPGNPVSAYLSFEVFVLPALRKMMGRTPLRRPHQWARLTRDIRSSAGREQYVRATYAYDERGASVTPVGGHGSHLIGDLSVADAVVVVPSEAEVVHGGSQVRVLLLDREF